jgi:hypothetical protein
MSNENWRVKCDGPGHILMRPHGHGCEHGFDIQCAEQLRDQLTVAIEEAKRQSDPWEKWLANQHSDWLHVWIAGYAIPLNAAQKIFEAAIASAKEGK